ncbi:hypothetical protein SRHO_G00080210 [Serrasalmus rhombeus]
MAQIRASQHLVSARGPCVLAIRTTQSQDGGKRRADGVSFMPQGKERTSATEHCVQKDEEEAEVCDRAGDPY